MNELMEHKDSCPYCGEVISVLIDSSVDEQEYIEDCQVCCRPITFYVSIDMDGDVRVNIASENE